MYPKDGFTAAFAHYAGLTDSQCVPVPDGSQAEAEPSSSNEFEPGSELHEMARMLDEAENYVSVPPPNPPLPKLHPAGVQ